MKAKTSGEVDLQGRPDADVPWWEDRWSQPLQEQHVLSRSRVLWLTVYVSASIHASRLVEVDA